MNGVFKNCPNCGSEWSEMSIDDDGICRCCVGPIILVTPYLIYRSFRIDDARVDINWFDSGCCEIECRPGRLFDSYCEIDVPYLPYDCTANQLKLYMVF